MGPAERSWGSGLHPIQFMQLLEKDEAGGGRVEEFGLCGHPPNSMLECSHVSGGKSAFKKKSIRSLRMFRPPRPWKQ